MNETRRRLGRAYADGAFRDTEYVSLLRAIDDQMRAATDACTPSYEEAAALFADLPALWDSAEHTERQRLLQPLIERVYLDIDSGLIGGITPTQGFGVLLDHALQRVETSRAMILTAQETRDNASRVGLVETGECPTRPARPDFCIYERRPFAVIITDFEPLPNVRAKRRKRT